MLHPPPKKKEMLQVTGTVSQQGLVKAKDIPVLILLAPELFF